MRRGIALLALREQTERLAQAAAGLSGSQALHAISAAYREYARRHPGRYAASVTAPPAGDDEYTKVAPRLSMWSPPRCRATTSTARG